MRDLREDLEPVWRATARVSAPAAGGRVIMFTSARLGEGVTSLAASFACIAARRSDKPVWMVELDLRRNPVFQGFQDGFARDVGKPGRAYDASLRQDPIYRITPRVEGARQSKLLTAHDIDGLPLLVTRFRGDRLKAGQKVRTQQAPAWWQALRGVSSWSASCGCRFTALHLRVRSGKRGRLRKSVCACPSSCCCWRSAPCLFSGPLILD